MTVKMKKDDDSFEAWNSGGFLFHAAEIDIANFESGKRLGSILSSVTKCPRGNATCYNAMCLELFGLHPEKDRCTVKVILCSLGITGDGEKCPLNM